MGGPHPRSTKEVTGYRVRARGGRVGHVEGLVVDDGDWTVRYAVVDTRDWLPGKKTPVAPAWISRVSLSEGEIHAEPSREEIETAPGWEPGTPIGRDYETETYAHYGRTPYWVRP